MAARARKQTVFVDFNVENHGSIYVLTPNTPAGRQWVEDRINIGADTQTWGNGIVVEHRYIGAIVEGLLQEGYGVN